jgi:predicted restriction endonuclease
MPNIHISEKCYKDGSDILKIITGKGKVIYISQDTGNYHYKDCKGFNQKHQAYANKDTVKSDNMNQLHLFVSDTILNNITKGFDFLIPEELEFGQQLTEGAKQKIIINRYERNSEVRKKCIEHYGYLCYVCGFDFQHKYGKLGYQFIHVHHKVALSEIREEYVVDPIQDLIPICPNCHSIIHRTKPALSIEELKSMLKEN